jgi:hypothetical protein
VLQQRASQGRALLGIGAGAKLVQQDQAAGVGIAQHLDHVAHV